MPPVSLHPLLPWWLLVAAGGVVALGCLLRVALPRGTSRAMWAGRTLLVAALVLLALRPAVPAPARTAEPIEVDVLLVLDTTTSMAATDGDDTAARRLDVARSDLAGVVDAFAGARFAAIQWDRAGRLELPWTTDASAALASLAVARVQPSGLSHGSGVAAVHERLSGFLDAHDREHPERSLYLVLAGDGEETSGRSAPSFEPLRRYVEDGIVIGYGSDAGAPMHDGTAEVIDPRSGAPAVSVRDESTLRTVAAQLGIAYAPHEDLEPVVSSAVPQASAVRGEGELPGGLAPVSWIVALFAVLWLTVEVAVAAVRAARLWWDVPGGRR